jgi:hypothetical protein
MFSLNLYLWGREGEEKLTRMYKYNREYLRILPIRVSI